jgi:hypothetical protein
MEHIARHQSKQVKQGKKSKHNKQIQNLESEKKALLRQIEHERQMQQTSPQTKMDFGKTSFLQPYQAATDYPDFKPTTLFTVTEDWRQQCFKEGNDYLLINYSERTFLTYTRAANCIQVRGEIWLLLASLF